MPIPSSSCGHLLVAYLAVPHVLASFPHPAHHPGFLDVVRPKIPLPHPHLKLPNLGRDKARIAARIDAYLDRADVPAVAVIEAVGAALCFAVSSVLEQAAAAEQPPQLALRFALLIRLLRSPRWMIGNLADIGGFLLQFLALRRGALALVSPLLVSGLVFSVVGNAIAQHRRPKRWEILGSAATVVGLSVFIATAQPGPGDPQASTVAWVSLFAVTAVLVGGAVLLARGPARRRALMLGVATGILYGVTSAVTEHTGHVLNRGVLFTLGTWAPYMLAVVSIVGLLLNQSAYQAGDLRLSLPIFTVLEPVVAILIGQLLFSEHIAGGAGARCGEVGGLLLMAVGVLWLARTVPDSAGADSPEAARAQPADRPG